MCARQKVEAKHLDPFSQEFDRASAYRECPREERTEASKKTSCNWQQAVTQTESPSQRFLDTSARAPGRITQGKSPLTPNNAVAMEKYRAAQHVRSTCSGPVLTSGLESLAAPASPLQDSSGLAGPMTAFTKRGHGPTALEAKSWRLLGNTSERLRRRREESVRRTLPEFLA